MAKQNKQSIESWTQREAQIKQERAEEFAKLSPDEQAKILAEAKIKFEEAQAKLKKELKYGDFDPGKRKKTDDDTKEKADKAKQLADLDRQLDPKVEAPKKEPKQAETAGAKRFATLFHAAEENIEQQKPFPFKSFALDDFHNQTARIAKMQKIVDHSQKNKDLSGRDIWKRLEENKSNPNKIGVVITTNIGGNNLQLEVSLTSLLEGHFSEKLTRFTNFVLFAVQINNTVKKTAHAPKEEDKKTVSQLDQRVPEELAKRSVTQIGENGGLELARGIFEAGQTNTIAFSFNNGAVWGTFDEHGAPDNPNELQEALDKTNTDK